LFHFFVKVGSPLELPKIDEPTNEQVNEYHAKFTDKLIELFETHKSKYIEDYKNISISLDDR
jgi:2-acylglycerol O-acyltransferase 2